MNIKTKTIAAALSLALVVGLSPAAAFAAPTGEGSIAPAQAPALQTQKVTDVESATEAMVKTCDALPAPSKVKFSDNKIVLKAMNAIGEFYVYGDEEGVTDDLSVDSCDAWTSMKQIALLQALEQAFGITFDIEESIEMDSVEAIREVLEARGLSLDE